MKITLWVPTASKRPESWEQVEAYMHTSVTPDVEQLYFLRTKPGNIKVIWNKAIKDFLESDSDYLWSVHDDVLYHYDTLPRLLSWGKPLISALVFHRQSPVLPHIWKSYEPGGPYAMRLQDTKKWFMERTGEIRFGPHVMVPRPDNALVEVSFTSTSCCLIHRKVFEDMKPLVGEEWFRLDNEIAGGGEDRNFFENALKVGYPCFVDRSCIAGHLVGNVPTGSADFMMWESVSTFPDTAEQKDGFKVAEQVAKTLDLVPEPKKRHRH